MIDPGPRRRSLPAEPLGRVHFVGIGGAGLSGIARIMVAPRRRGHRQRRQGLRALAALRALGATCYVGHDAEQVADADTVVVSTAVREDNPEVLERPGRGLRVLPRAAGTRVGDGRPPGGRGRRHPRQDHHDLAAHGGAAALRRRPVVRDRRRRSSESGSTPTTAPATCSSPRPTRATAPFLVYSPDGAVVTNVEADHLDNYGDEEAYRAAFDAVRRPGRARAASWWSAPTTPGAARLADVAGARGLDVVHVGESDGRRPAASTGPALRRRARRRSTSSARRAARPTVALQVPGTHYVARRAGRAGGRAPARASPSTTCARARGVHRHRPADGAQGRGGGVRVYDSYAHHPTEIAGDLQAARALAGDGPRWSSCFQPHLSQPHPHLRARRWARRSARPTRSW